VRFVDSAERAVRFTVTNPFIIKTGVYIPKEYHCLSRGMPVLGEWSAKRKNGGLRCSPLTMNHLWRRRSNKAIFASNKFTLAGTSAEQ
jgi:hypothetical protein